jgi:hypothetical protein
MIVHHANEDFWSLYDALPEEVRERADKAYALLKVNPRHPSLHLKHAGPYWSARIDLQIGRAHV